MWDRFLCRYLGIAARVKGREWSKCKTLPIMFPPEPPFHHFIDKAFVELPFEERVSHDI